MKTFRTACRALVACALTLVLAAPAQADPTGDQYLFSGINFPDTYGPVTLTFDGIAEQAGGMMVNERSNNFAGIPGGIITNFGPLTSYANAGEVVEWSFSTINGQTFSNDPSAPWGFSIEELEWLNMPGVPAVAVQSTSYLYLTQNGVPRTINPAVATFLNVVVGPHPFDPSVPQVVYITGQSEELFPNGVASLFLEPDDTEDFPAALLQQLFATNPINDVHAGIMFQHIPEPSTLVLGVAGLAGLVLVALRRRVA